MTKQRTKNVWKYVLPTMLSSVCFFLFTVVDGIFVGNGVGTNALGAVNIVFPMVLVVGALFMLATIGGVTVVAIRLGRGDVAGANKVFMHSALLVLVIGAVFTVGVALFARQICALLGANETFLDLGTDYLFWYSLFAIPSGAALCLEGFCRNDGSPGLVGMAVILSTLANVFLDWLFIYPLSMGTAGAALATGLSQTLSLLIVLSHFWRKKGQLRLHLPQLEPALFRKIFFRGLPEAIAQLAAPVMTLCMNLVLVNRIGDIGVNTFSVIMYVASFTVAIFYGTSEGLQPLFGQSYGAKNEADLRFYFRVGLILNIVGSAAVVGLVLLFCRPVCAVFGIDEQTLANTLQTMPKFAWGFVAMSISVMISAYLYSTKRSGYAIVLNTLRSLVVNTTVIFLLPAIFGAGIVWYTFGIYETIMAGIALALLRRSQRNGIVFK